MSYVLHCLNCNGDSKLHDNLRVGQCPKCGIGIVPIAQEDNTVICDKYRLLPIIRNAVKQYKGMCKTI